MSYPHPFQTKNLLFRAIEDSDDAFMKTVQSDPIALAKSSARLQTPKSMASSVRWKKNMLENSMLAVIICLTPTAPTWTETSPGPYSAPPTPIGVISLTSLPPAAAHHRNSWISVDIIAAYQGHGYGSEAIRWVLKWGFQTAGLHRIGIEAFEYNEGAVKLYERLGFQPEGRRRECLWWEGHWWDELQFAMLEGEWREISKEW
jgi:RimJ/RimL family protein N-acetyltransferase